ncbi:MAG: hypothetical protein JXA23_02765, partial [Bacteroidales bacterium]|nr:hypothetical protein [Bacteroidales bacterium]
MNQQYPPAHFIVVWMVLLLAIFSGCEKFKGDQTIPAYITIDSIYLSTSPSIQGSASAAITDAWVFINDVQIGTFQLPARFPVLHQGTQTVKVLPGIKQNGVAATRASYPFFAPVEITVELNELDTAALGVLKTTYISTTVFDMIEGFEGVTLLLDTTN